MNSNYAGHNYAVLSQEAVTEKSRGGLYQAIYFSTADTDLISP